MSNTFEMDRVYDPKAVEGRWYTYWEEKGFFHAEPNPDRKPYTIVIPPPNVTGILTIGHVLNNSIQDVVIRWKRMQGYETLWMPGTDHAGIATQNRVEQALAREGKTRHDLGRERFVEQVWDWKERHGGLIIEQLKLLGCSCDWARERFTMDEGLSRAVQEVFVRLYERGLIYRGKYIVNWCPRCHTALSDEESIHEEEQGHLWYIRYPIKGEDMYITVATTRPETMLGDTAVAVHPEDERHRAWIGKTAILPLIEREIPILADDEYVDPEFGTGAVKVTPAHDPNDFLIGRKHDLPQVNVMNGDGTMNEDAGAKYAGMDRFVCRAAVVEDLKKKGLLGKTEGHAHTVGHCQRCDTIVEPYLSDQWFVRMEPLARPAIQAAREGELRFYPERWTRVYLNWLENIRDWCISRQLWWGHRIPVWYCPCGEHIVARTEPERCPRCGETELRQDEDVLDTWFSSWLWPFSTLGWPEETPELQYFYPTDLLVTAPDIIFFWVARMVMSGYEFMGERPFTDIYLHGIVRDSEGRKMSKSLGNSPDPAELIDRYGADALRFSMIMMVPQGQDGYYADEKVETGRNFANKIWNAARLVLSNLDDLDPEDGGEETPELADRWILSRLARTNATVDEMLGRYRFNDAAHAIYDFIWHDYCDWYLELIKPRLYGSDASAKSTAQRVMSGVLERAMRLLHPVMPFVTEEIWRRLPKQNGGPESIILAAWPEPDPEAIDEAAEQAMEIVQETVVAIRNIRGEMNVPPSKRADAVIRPSSADVLEVLEQNRGYLMDLGKVRELSVGSGLEKPRASASGLARDAEIFVPLEGLIDLDAERARLTKEKDRLSKLLSNLERKLGNTSFLTKAPEEVVARERAKREEYEAALRKIEENLGALGEDS